MKMNCRVVMSSLAMLWALTVSAYAGDEAPRPVIDDRGLAWEVWGSAAYIPRVDPRVKGGIIQRVTIPDKPKWSWDAGSWSAITIPVHKGDVLLVAFWARAEKMPADSDLIEFYGLINEYAPPNKPATPKTHYFAGKEWKLHYASGIAAKDYAPNELTVSIQLGTGIQTIDMGPLTITNYGQRYDLSKLPHD